MKFKLFGGVCTTLYVSLCAGILSVSAASTPFSRVLTIGSSGEDVRALQIILNRDPATRVSDSGPGSLGNETSYFGARTAAAVIQFQEKYATDVLYPVGLAAGTGYVGTKTLNKLNALAANLNSTVSNANSYSQVSTSSGSILNHIEKPASFTIDPALQKALALGVVPQWAAFGDTTPDSLMIFGLSHNRIRPGDHLTIFGQGFGTSTTIHFGPNSQIIFHATSSNTMTVNVPALPYGTYQVWAENNHGSTKSVSAQYITVGAVTDSRPHILSVSPAFVGQNDSVTVTASALDAFTNTVYSSLGILHAVPSIDGKTMTFRVTDLPKAELIFQGQRVAPLTVSFGIGTSAGMSLEYGYFTISQ
jgi:peptidoglycan hydrolase-like protein with peptidoglycan-binding domain